MAIKPTFWRRINILGDKNMYNFAMPDNYELMIEAYAYGNDFPEYELDNSSEEDEDFDDEESEEAKIYRMINENIEKEKQEQLREEHELLLSFRNMPY